MAPQRNLSWHRCWAAGGLPNWGRSRRAARLVAWLPRYQAKPSVRRPEKRAAVRTSQSQREPAVEVVERGPGELDAGGVQSGPDLREHGREVGALREVEGDLGGNVRGCALCREPVAGGGLGLMQDEQTA